MPADHALRSSRPVTRSELVRDFRALGVRPGGILMVHTRTSAIGWVVGGSQAVVEALLEALGPDGTLMAYAGWQDDPSDLAAWPAEWQQAYRAELPPFDAELSEADHDMGRIPERIRTWPGAKASTAHVARMVAIGSRADWLTRDQPRDFPAGAGSPLAKITEAGGQVLMIGSPLSTITLLHHAEALVDGPEKRMVAYAVPVTEGDRVVWREFMTRTQDPWAPSRMNAWPRGHPAPSPPSGALRWPRDAGSPARLETRRVISSQPGRWWTSPPGGCGVTSARDAPDPERAALPAAVPPSAARDPRAAGPRSAESQQRFPLRRDSCRLWCSCPVNGKPIERIAKRIHRWLNEVIPNCLCGLGLRGSHQRARHIRRMLGLVEGNLLGLGI
jgi:aminoglycoside 3-N-acetyltransferase